MFRFDRTGQIARNIKLALNPRYVPCLNTPTSFFCIFLLKWMSDRDQFEVERNGMVWGNFQIDKMEG